jgi:hypothetical protein
LVTIRSQRRTISFRLPSVVPLFDRSTGRVAHLPLDRVDDRALLRGGADQHRRALLVDERSASSAKYSGRQHLAAPKAAPGLSRISGGLPSPPGGQVRVEAAAGEDVAASRCSPGRDEQLQPQVGMLEPR